MGNLKRKEQRECIPDTIWTNLLDVDGVRDLLIHVAQILSEDYIKYVKRDETP